MVPPKPGVVENGVYSFDGRYEVVEPRMGKREVEKRGVKIGGTGKDAQRQLRTKNGQEGARGKRRALYRATLERVW